MTEPTPPDDGETLPDVENDPVLEPADTEPEDDD